MRKEFFEVTSSIPREDVECLITTGLEQGIGYWAGQKLDRPLNFNSPTPYLDQIERGNVSIIISDEDSPNPNQSKKHLLTLQNILDGLQLMANKHTHHFANFLLGEYDAETGDVFIQLCALKKIVYG